MICNFERLSFQILTVDRFFHKKGYFDVKPRPYAALSFRVSGTGAFESQGKKFSSQAGDVLFIPADTPYQVEYSVGESIVVHFQLCNYPSFENIELGAIPLIALKFQQLLDAWNESHSVNEAKSLIYGILAHMERDRLNRVADTGFARCLSYMEQHFCQPELDVAGVCKLGFVSVSGLQRAFSSHLGISPKQYLLKLRMNRALELLAENTLSIKEIAFACGFQDEKYFSRAFRKKYGYPPSRFLDHMKL